MAAEPTAISGLHAHLKSDVASQEATSFRTRTLLASQDVNRDGFRPVVLKSGRPNDLCKEEMYSITSLLP